MNVKKVYVQCIIKLMEKLCWQDSKNLFFENFLCEHNLAEAGFASTLDDYMQFAKMLQNEGNPQTKV